MEITPARAMGGDARKSMIQQDRLGRILIGSDSLQVFDGQSWSSHAKPSPYSLRSLIPDKVGRLWTAMFTDIGYFTEEPLGTFKYHSLVPQLPPSLREIGAVWGCASVGSDIYFFGKDQLLRWDGQAFQATPFPTSLRLSPLKIGDEFWFHHLETGLYRLTEAGPQLSVPASQLGTKLIIGLIRDESGLITISNEGLIRPGEPAPFSSERLNQYLTQHRVSAFTELPNGNLAIGTVSGGLVLANHSGGVIRIWADTGSGLPGREITSLTTDTSGEILGTTPTDFFHLPATGESTVFNALNGLKGQAVNDLVFWRSTLHAATDDGIYRLDTSAEGVAQFQAVPSLAVSSGHMLPCDDGLLLSRFGGVDWFDGTTTRTVYPLQANSAIFVQPARTNPRLFYVAEVNRLVRLDRQADGSFASSRFLELPDTCISLHEDSSGRLWLGTVAKGAFCYDPATRRLTPLIDPVTAQPTQGLTWVVGNEARLLFFLKDHVLQAGPQGRDLRELPNLPVITPSIVRAIPGSEDVLVVYRLPAGTQGPLHGAGVLSFDRDGLARWRELDLGSLDAIGSIRTATFAEENHRPILWLGGMQGILRLDYDKIPTLLPPAPPIIKVPDLPGGPVPSYPHKNHRVQFRVFTGDYVRSKDLVFQTRLGEGGGEWSSASARRSFEYTNLSEGDYRFEVRAVNRAGQTSAPAVFTFRILPPWYRSGWAFAGYVAALGLAVFGFIRVRERRIRARNQELETLVEVRTAELVKASAAKDEFLAGVSHEIRNPMNGVIGIAENFRTEGLDAESRRKFSLLRQCASHLSSLLEDILDFSKVQAGAIELDPKPFDLPELVESVAAITRADSEKYGVPVELAVSPAVPRELVGDARRIRQILINFVSNALKFSGRGQVSVTVWCKSLGIARTEVIFAVSDEGPGISAEEQARLFTRFERGAAAQKGRVPGTGLGLALCKGLAEKMGGRIWLESELGQGSCLYFSAPFAVAAAAAEPAAGATPAAAPAGRTALVVDDQEYNRIVLADLLQSMGFIVHAAQEGSAALALAGRQTFDVVFLDFNLPGLSGVDVARAIRTLPNASAHALILATTAFTTPEKRAQCLDAGMDAFLGKPVTRERLAKALAGLQPVATAPAPVAAPVAQPSARASSGPADRLGNLRLLARKKGVPFADELALYLSELEVELGQLEAAVAQADAAEAGRCAHLLVGRCGFIYEREMEQTQRTLEAAVGSAHWDEVRRLLGEFAVQLADLRVRVAASSGPAAPPA
ncbi:ATP-binding protein [Opitutus sp. GAS368]|uniref:hybrid sensor histidine kinase/response regulator n=1 Tax=Opitutus sp. GAS368 TaxID=1882749 RepID=UPI001560C779|nr:ATP-binding protein [Opitutus sp. GAS368]